MLSIGLGHALAARVDGRDDHAYVMIGDAESDKPQELLEKYGLMPGDIVHTVERLLARK